MGPILELHQTKVKIDSRTTSKRGQGGIRRSREQSIDVDEGQIQSRQIQQQHTQVNPPPNNPLSIRDGAHDRSRSTESHNNNAYNINYPQERIYYSNE